MKEIIVNKAVELFESGFNCAESTLKAIIDTKIPEHNFPVRIASGFGGGIAHTGNICGALSGCILAINLLYGRDDKGINYDKNRVLVEKLIKYFEEKYGSCTCPGLTDCDYNTEEGKAKFALPERREKCKEYVREAVQKTIELIEE